MHTESEASVQLMAGPSASVAIHAVSPPKND